MKWKKRRSGGLVLGLVSLAALVPSIAAAQQLVPTERIVGGTAPTRPWPAQGYLEIVQPNGPAKVCGGTLLSGRWFLTAGHCASTSTSSPPAGVEIAPSGFTVNLGESDITQFSGPERFAVDDVRRDPLFMRHGATAIHDLALLHLATPTPATPRFEPMRLIAADEASLWASGVVGTIIGWGATVFGGARPTQLQQAGVPILPDGTCAAAYPLSGPNPFDVLTMFCAGDGTADTCMGDSGGPIMVPRVDTFALAGVTSYGFECASASQPGVYARAGAPAENVWVRSQIPTAAIAIDPPRPAPDTPVDLIATGTRPLDQLGLRTYRWDLDDDGQYDDATGAATTLPRIRAGSTVVRVEESYPDGDRALAREVVTTAGSPLPQPPPPPPPPPKPASPDAAPAPEPPAAEVAPATDPVRSSSLPPRPLARLLAGPRIVSVRSLLDGRMTIGVSCSLRCSLKARLTLDGRTARTLRLRRVDRAVLIGAGSRRLEAGSVKLTVRLTPKAVRALRRARSGAVRVRVKATSGARVLALERTLKLRR